MTDREKRVIRAFINCVITGQYTIEYAKELLNNKEKFGYLSQEAKDSFYSMFGVVEESVGA